MHVAGDAEEGTDIREVLANGPVMDFGNLGIVGDVAFVIALVSKYCDFGDGNLDLLHRDGGSGTMEMVENAVDVIEVLPDEVSNLGVGWNGFIPSILCLIVRRQSFDAGVIHKC